MADYKLKLDIDEKELQRKIQNALKGANINLGGGGVGGSSSSQSSGAARAITLQKQIISSMSQLEDKKAANTKALKEQMYMYKKNLLAQTKVNQAANKQASFKNAMARGVGGGPFKSMGQLIGGRFGGAMGQGLDVMQAHRQGPKAGAKGFFGAGGTCGAGEQQSMRAKRIPQAVKIMGIAAGLAGAAGLGKMLIDSSPMMKAMLKLLNTGVMLVLRPIGDMIGLLLLPMMVNFVKMAVDWYTGWTELYPMFQDWGKAIGDFFADPVGALSGIFDFFPEVFGCMDGFGDLDIQGWWDGVVRNITGSWGGFISWMRSSIWQPIQNAWISITGVFSDMGKGVEYLYGEWVKFSTYMHMIGENAWSFLAKEWDKVLIFFGSIGATSSNWLSDQWANLISWFGVVGHDTTNWLVDTWVNIVNFFDDIVGSLQSIWGIIQSFLRSIAVGLGFSPSSGSGSGSSSASSGRRRYASGGLITEPIMGIGQNSGRGYLFGESGPETVTPGIGSSSGGGGNTTINIYATGVEDIEYKLKPMLLRLMKESRARAGIL